MASHISGFVYFKFAVLCFVFTMFCFPNANAETGNHKIDSLDNALKIARNTAQRCNALITYAQYYTRLADSTKAFGYLNTALAEATRENNDSLQSVIYWYYANMLQIFMQDDRSLLFLEKVRWEQLGFLKNRKAHVYYLKSVAYYRRGKYPESVEFCLNGLKESADTTDFLNIGYLHRQLALSLGVSGNLKEVKEHNAIALKYIEKAGDFTSQGFMHVSIAVVYGNNGDTKNQEKHLLMAVPLFRAGKSYRGLSNAFSNLGGFETNRGNFKKALWYVSESLRLRRDSVVGGVGPEHLIMLANLYYEMKDYKSAVYYIDSVINMARKQNKKGLLLDYYFYKASYLEESGKYREANIFFRKHYDLKDTLYRFESEKILRNAYTKYETEVKEKENLVLKKDLQIESSRRIFLIIGIAALVCVLVLLSIIYFTRLKSAESKRQLLEQNLANEQLRLEQQRITALAKEREHELQQIAFEAEQSKMLTEQQALKADLEQKNNKLSNLTAYMVRKNEIISGVKRGIGKLQYLSKDIQKVMNDIDEYIDIQEEWEEFLKSFEDVNPGFTARILEICPDLTQKEIKMCSYIRMNLDVKQIGRLLNITDASIHNFRSRLRKKLNIDAGADLNMTIMEI